MGSPDDPSRPNTKDSDALGIQSPMSFFVDEQNDDIIAQLYDLSSDDGFSDILDDDLPSPHEFRISMPSPSDADNVSGNPPQRPPTEPRSRMRPTGRHRADTRPRPPGPVKIRIHMKEHLLRCLVPISLLIGFTFIMALLQVYGDNSSMDYFYGVKNADDWEKMVQWLTMIQQNKTLQIGFPSILVQRKWGGYGDSGQVRFTEFLDHLEEEKSQAESLSTQELPSRGNKQTVPDSGHSGRDSGYANNDTGHLFKTQDRPEGLKRQVLLLNDFIFRKLDHLIEHVKAIGDLLCVFIFLMTILFLLILPYLEAFKTKIRRIVSQKSPSMGNHPLELRQEAGLLAPSGQNQGSASSCIEIPSTRERSSDTTGDNNVGPVPFPCGPLSSVSPAEAELHSPVGNGQEQRETTETMIYSKGQSLFLFKHRWIHGLVFLRRLIMIIAINYGLRGLLVWVTIFPQESYECIPMLTTNAWESMLLALQMVIGTHRACFDFIFSGHTSLTTICSWFWFVYSANVLLHPRRFYMDIHEEDQHHLCLDNAEADGVDKPVVFGAPLHRPLAIQSPVGQSSGHPELDLAPPNTVPPQNTDGTPAVVKDTSPTNPSPPSINMSRKKHRKRHFAVYQQPRPSSKSSLFLLWVVRILCALFLVVIATFMTISKIHYSVDIGIGLIIGTLLFWFYHALLSLFYYFQFKKSLVDDESIGSLFPFSDGPNYPSKPSNRTLWKKQSNREIRDILVPLKRMNYFLSFLGYIDGYDLYKKDNIGFTGHPI